MEEKYKLTLTEEEQGIFDIELCSFNNMESASRWCKHYYKQCLIKLMYLIEDNPNKKETLKKAFLNLKMEDDPNEEELSKRRYNAPFKINKEKIITPFLFLICSNPNPYSNPNRSS